MLKCHRRILLSGPLRRHASSSSTLPRIKVDLERYLQDTTATMALLEERKVPFSREHLQELETNENSRKGLTRQLDELRRHQKSFHSDTRLKDQAIELRREVKLCSTALKDTEERIERLSNSLPNWTAPNVPVGDYQACQVVHTSDRAPRTLSQTEQEACDHLDVATRLGWLDFSSGQRISGPRWPVLKREGALLEWALTQYALQRATAYGFQPFNPPDVVKTALSDRCGFQPRDGQASQSYYVSADASASTNEDHNEERPELVLAGTAEIPLAGHFTHQTFQPSDLPQQLVALGRAFRAEAGARGKEHRGLYRVHQFTKAELFVVCHPDESEAWLDQLTQLQLDILDGLHLPLRMLHMSTEELGASACRKYDIEGWMPGRGSWGELTSASNCSDYQSRRLGIKVTTPEGRKVFAHTLNATAAAIPRLIVALIENGVQKDGDEEWVELPRKLSPFWLGPQDQQGVQDSKGHYVIRWTK